MDLQQEIQKQTEFTVDFYKRIADQHPGSNVAVSVISVSITLALAAAGARGSTRDQFHSSSLRLPSGDFLHEFADQLKSQVLVDGSSKGGPVLALANGVWMEKTLELKPRFLQIVKEKHHSETRPSDFQHKAEDVRKDVNAWAEEHTQGRIKDLLPPGGVGRDTRLVLANAIYFKGRWREPFLASETKNDIFYLLDGTTVTVPMMTSREDQYVGHFREDGYKVLRLPYARGSDSRSFSMYFLLPDQRTGLPDLERKLDPSFLGQKLDRLRKGSVSEFKLPRFKISSQLDVPNVLKSLGLELPFSQQADFGDLVEAPVYLSNVFHKAFVEVNEEGTEAAAATAATMSLLCYTPPQRFVADHPFLFVIKEDQTGLVLFVGKVTSPT